MKPLNFGSQIMWRVFGMVAALALTLAAVAPAYADDGTATTPGDGKRAEWLEKAFQREQEWLNVQQNNLNRAHELADKVQARIDELKGEGKDTSALEAALATFNQQLATAQGQHDAAASILSAHAGFDESGHVTDLEQARQTVLDARKALRDARLTLRNAIRDLRMAIRDYRQANRPNS